MTMRYMDNAQIFLHKVLFPLTDPQKCSHVTEMQRNKDFYDTYFQRKLSTASQSL